LTSATGATAFGLAATGSFCTNGLGDFMIHHASPAAIATPIIMPTRMPVSKGLPPLRGAADLLPVFLLISLFLTFVPVR
jgi:hypothetical protein